MKAFQSQIQWVRRDKVTLRTTCIKNVVFKIIKKDRLSEFRILLLQRNLNWVVRNLRLGREFDIAVSEGTLVTSHRQSFSISVACFDFASKNFWEWNHM